MLKFGQDVALRGTEKLMLFFPEKVCRRGATHFFIRKITIFTKKIPIFHIKSVQRRDRTLFREKNTSFSVHLRATCWPNFSTIAFLVAKPQRNQIFRENSIFSKKCPFLVENPQNFPNFPLFAKIFVKFHKPYWPTGLDKVWSESGQKLQHYDSLNPFLEHFPLYKSLYKPSDP